MLGILLINEIGIVLFPSQVNAFTLPIEEPELQREWVSQAGREQCFMVIAKSKSEFIIRR
jgi:hypothetical protein